MSGPVSPPLATTESGTATIVRPTNTLEFNGADFTVTGSGSKATISIDSTGTGAALTATQVGFGDSSNLLTGSTSLTFDDTNKKLTITGDADNDVVLEIIGSDTASEAGPRLRITNDSGTDSAIDLVMDNFAVGYLEAGTPGGTMRNVMQFGQMSSDNYTVVFNEDGLAADFRIEGDTDVNLFFADGGDDAIGIGRAPLTADAKVQIDVGNSTRRALDLISDDSDADAAPTLRFHRESSSPGVQDATGQIEFSGKDLAGQEQVYATISSHIVDPSNLSEDGDLRFKVIVAGSEQEFLRMNNFGVIFNEIGIDQNFKIETVGNNKMFRVDGGLNMVAVGDDPTSGGATFQVPDNTISSYRNVVSSTTSPMTLTNDDLQSQLIAHASATALTINLPLDGGVKGQYFQFVSTGGDITIVPSAVAGDTINGGTASLTRATNNEIYDCVCIASNTWILSNPA